MPDSSNLPVQRIGPDDLLGISVYDSPELTRTVRVNTEGTVRLPMVKAKIRAVGLLPVDLENEISRVLKEEQLMVDPVVTVSVVEYRSRPIKVVGAVKKPITFQAVGPTNLLDAISEAEGLTDDAGPEILVSRQQPDAEGRPVTLTQRISVKSLMDATDSELNLALHGGEEIRVPDAGRIFVLGNVKKPGSFPVKDSTETSVFKIMAMAEGLLPYSGKTAYIYRREGAGGAKNEIPINLEKIMQRKSPDVVLLANDILYVPDRTGQRQLMTALERTIPLGAALASGVLFAVYK
ncbi:MAG TPA: polysaccharide biosynthesis/export family protein [Bryobacteraceae bacterium]|jgi:polysaccharide export outer membrane protein